MSLTNEQPLAVDPAGSDFDTFYRDRWQPTVRFAALTTGSVALAEEVAQEAFTEVLHRWSELRSPAAYLRRCVASRCTSWVRRQRLERRVVVHAPLGHVDTHLVEMIDVLRRLSPRQRAAVYLRYVDDLSEAEIADSLSCRPGTVKSLLARARTQLESELAP